MSLISQSEPFHFCTRLPSRSEFVLGGGARATSVQKVLSRAHARAVRAPNVKFGVFTLLAGVRLRDVGLADFGAGQVDPGVALVAFDHRSAGEGLHTETRHEVPRVVVYKSENRVRM